MPRPSSAVRHPGLRMPLAAPPANPANAMEKLVNARLLQKVRSFMRCEKLNAYIIGTARFEVSKRGKDGTGEDRSC